MINESTKEKLRDLRLTEMLEAYEDEELTLNHLALILIIEMSACDFIRANKTVVITGSAGTGKTWLSCAIGKQACKLGYRTQYIRMPDLIERAGIYGKRKTIEKFAKYDLLILDEWLLYPFEDEEVTLMLEILERRYDSKSTILDQRFMTRRNGIQDWGNPQEQTPSWKEVSITQYVSYLGH